MKRLSALLIVLALPLTGLGLLGPRAEATTQGLWRTYYYNYFNYKSTCEARGKAITDE